MHPYAMPQFIKDRILRRRGRIWAHEAIDAGKTALLVVDMQNYFVAEGFASEVPGARSIVPNINRMAQALRSAGGTVVYIQTTAAGVLQTWANYHTYMMLPANRDRRLTQLDERHDGFKLYAGLEPQPGDLHVKKTKFSAFIDGSSDIDEQLRSRGIESLLIAGTLTNVCCESSARDAMMRDYRVVMLADGNAALTDEEHAAALNNVAVYFGDVMTTDEALGCLVAAKK